jgi:hypothetical protein
VHTDFAAEGGPSNTRLGLDDGADCAGISMGHTLIHRDVVLTS